MGSLPSFTVSNFRGMNTAKDKLSLLEGQLSLNRNYLYMPDGGLEERGGGLLLKAPPSAGELFSLANFRGASGIEFLVTNQGTDAYYFASNQWNALSLTLTTSLITRWAQAGKGSVASLYGVNGTDSVIKITEVAGTPTGSAVPNSPTTADSIIFHKNRLFSTDSSTLYFTEALDYDTWNTNVNTIDIAPGRDGDIKGMGIWGDALFIFKEYGVYVLPNADDISPKINWIILRTDAAIGTQSPDSIKTTRAGIMYLSTDGHVRILSPSVSFSTGEYTLGGSGSPIVSHAIKDDLIANQNSRLAFASALVHNDLYILSYQSTSATSNFNDKTFFADTSKFIQWPEIQQPQPYWGEFTGFDYQFYAQQNASGRIKVYGVKGVSTIGQTHETLNETIHNDNSIGIDAYAILGWTPIGGASTYKNIKQIYMVADTETWDIQVTIAAYKYRQSLPGNGEGIQRTYTTEDIAGVGIVGTGTVGSSVVGNIGVSSNRFRFSLKGYYFKIEFRNQNVDEFTRINRVIVYYRPIKNK